MEGKNDSKSISAGVVGRHGPSLETLVVHFEFGLIVSPVKPTAIYLYRKTHIYLFTAPVRCTHYLILHLVNLHHSLLTLWL